MTGNTLHLLYPHYIRKCLDSRLLEQVWKFERIGKIEATLIYVLLRPALCGTIWKQCLVAWACANGRPEMSLKRPEMSLKFSVCYCGGFKMQSCPPRAGLVVQHVFCQYKWVSGREGFWRVTLSRYLLAYNHYRRFSLLCSWLRCHANSSWTFMRPGPCGPQNYSSDLLVAR